MEKFLDQFDWKCSICLNLCCLTDTNDQSVVTCIGCNKFFHAQCFLKYEQQCFSSECPTCRYHQHGNWTRDLSRLEKSINFEYKKTCDTCGLQGAGQNFFDHCCLQTLDSSIGKSQCTKIMDQLYSHFDENVKLKIKSDAQNHFYFSTKTGHGFIDIGTEVFTISFEYSISPELSTLSEKSELECSKCKNKMQKNPKYRGKKPLCETCRTK